MPSDGGADLNLNLDVELAALDPAERRYLQDMLKKLKGGNSSGLKAFLEQDYDEAPVSMNRFIDDDKYLGRVLKDPKGNSLIYEYWQEALNMIASSNAVEVILTGPIGSGKSTIVDIYMAYVLHSMLCLRDPFEYFGLVRAQPITLLFFSLSKDLSQVGLFKGFNELLLHSPWFRERGIMGGGSRHQYLRFPHKNIDYSLGAPKVPGQGIVGRNIITGGLDEISEVTSAKEIEAGAHQDFVGTRALQIYEKVARRMESRFLQGGRQPGKLFLVSSKQDEAAFIERYVEKVKGSPHVIIFDDPIWEIKPRKMFSGVTFGVAIGDKYRDSRIMGDDDDEDELEEQGYDVIHPPIEYLRSFELDVNGALRDIAGVSSSTTRRSRLIPRAEYLKRCINPDLHHPFTDQVVYLSNEKGDDTGIEDYFKMDDAFTTSPYRSIHIDLGLNGDAAGISMCHINHVKEIERMMEDGTFLKMRDHVIRFDFMLRISNVTGASIPFWKIRRFIIFLRKRKVKIGCVSCDGWQSVDFLQLMENASFNTQLLSIDRNDIPYVTFRNAIYEERIEWYGYDPMLSEASELEHLRRKKKVDHPVGGSKDVSDSGAGALFMTLKNAGNQPSPDKTVEALKAMQHERTGGLDPKWWLKDI